MENITTSFRTQKHKGVKNRYELICDFGYMQIAVNSWTMSNAMELTIIDGEHRHLVCSYDWRELHGQYGKEVDFCIDKSITYSFHSDQAKRKKEVICNNMLSKEMANQSLILN